MVTSGGICVDEIDEGTMQSSLVKNLYLAGEMLDIDAACGGYNITFANGNRLYCRNECCKVFIC